ncbi:MAG: M13 family metallopeptidase [Acidobacteriota bacterium]|jgi:putative endopeptidase|nr:M13 family metallopeptidase [Acidobacteriota bacterium]
MDMKKVLYIVTIFCMALPAGCRKDEGAGGATAPAAPLASGIDAANLDQSADPKADFYQYAGGGWMKNHPLKDEYARFGSFEQVAEVNREQLRQLIEDVSAGSNEAGSIAQKIGDFYNVGMGIDAINRQGAAPLEGELRRIAALKDKSELTGQLARMALQGDALVVEIDADADLKDSDMTIAWLYQGGLGIGDRDYYLSQDKHFAETRAAYAKMLAKMLALSGYSKLAGFEGGEAAMAARILAFETRLAEIDMPKEELREPEKIYHIKTVDEVQRIVPSIKWREYLDGLGLGAVSTVNAATLPYFEKLDKVVAGSDWETLKAYCAASTVIGAADFLGDELSDVKFDFYGRVLSGKKEQQPRWKRVLSAVERGMGEALGRLYVEKHFPASAKERMLQLVENLRFTLGERIKKNTWMTGPTKERALDKLAAFRVKIGYPDKWRDFSGLEVGKDSYYANVSRAAAFNTRYELDKIGKPVDRDEWHMTPQTVNAYYNPSTNEICFPAGILQPPFFDAAADDAANYGAIGVVIGHEMTHGFDDQGRKFDKVGNLHDWWTPADSAAFDARKQTLADWFSGIEVLRVDGKPLHANGEFTLGENIADNGGLNISFEAMQKALRDGGIDKEKMDGFTPEQRFFLAYAIVWAGNIRDSEVIRRTKEDPHALGRWRVNGALPHVAPFLEAFGVKEGDAMYLAPGKRVEIW